MTQATVLTQAVPVAALVVGFKPDLAALDALLLRLLNEVQQVVLLDNGGASGFLNGQQEDRNRVLYIDMEGNRGLGAALNRGMEEARRCGLRYVLTFDQDSAPPAGMAAALYMEMLAAQAEGLDCAAIGPSFYDKREDQARSFPLYKEEGGRIHLVQADATEPRQEVDVLITSGMLVDSDAWNNRLPYNEALMVEYTDTDWCFRARAAGYRLFVLTSLRMPHAVSDAPPVRFMGVNLLRYSPLRRYYYFRNTMYFVRQPYVSPAWRKRLLAGVPVRLCSHVIMDEHRLQGLLMSLKGLWHGLRGKLGPYPS